MSLYLKYRPKKIDELDLSSVRETLWKMVESSNLSHAYLFTGPRGSGKTSAARILAKVINCKENEKKMGEPCGKCESCVTIERGATDIVEIDAASNRGIDDIRELKQKIGLAPSLLLKKVYIIDEVHMLTTEAFNALLKTLEEPPGHTIFILCTTEAHKVPETIVSRCTRIKFSKANSDEMKRSLSRVIKGEKGDISEEAVVYLAGRVDGSFRDGVKILDQLLSGRAKVEVEDVKKALYGAANFDPRAFSQALLARDTSLALQIFRAAREQGIDYGYFLMETMGDVRDALLARYGVGESELVVDREEEGVELVYLIDDTMRRIGYSKVPDVVVELMILKWCGDGDDVGREGGGPKIEKNGEKKVKNGKETEKTIDNEVKVAEVKMAPSIDKNELEGYWAKVLRRAEKSSYSLEALLSKSWPRGVEGDELVIEVAYDFHRQQLATSRFRALVESLVRDVFAFPLRCRFELGDRVSDLTANDLRSIGENGNISASVAEEEGDDVIELAEEIFIN